MVINLIARRVAGFFLLLLLASCAAPQTRQMQNQTPAGLPQKFELAQVPFFPQDAYQCGPAALATVLNVAGFPVQPDALPPREHASGNAGRRAAQRCVGV
jgi:hypothetical protein